MNASAYDRMNYYVTKLGTMQASIASGAKLLYYETNKDPSGIPGVCMDPNMYYLRNNAMCNLDKPYI